jgi:hypothetical protein
LKPDSLRPYLALWGLRGAWALAVALWALAAVPWFQPPTASPPAAPSPIARSASPATAGDATNEAPEPTYVAQRLRAPAAAEPTARPAAEGAVCGLSDAAGSQDTPSAAQRQAHVARHTALGLQHAVDGLRTRAEPMAQGAGWWLRVLMARDAVPDTPTPLCVPGTDCTPAPVLPPLATAVESLGHLAQASSDPWLQQIAQRACGTAATPAVCAMLGARRWSTLEPDNAAAWLELANRDPQAVDEALFGATRAVRFDTHRGRLANWVVQSMPEQLPMLQRHAAWQRADELERASDAAAMAAAARHCSEAAQRDANRAQLCERVARWLAPARVPTSEAAGAVASRSLDCPTLERQWREARETAQAGSRVAVQSAPAARP